MVKPGAENQAEDLLSQATAVAAAVADPELPFLTVHDLGILREVRLEQGVVVAQVSPTYSGCPAVAVIENSIADALQQAGFNARVERVMSPPWTTEWITESGRRKLIDNGIAPPTAPGTSKSLLFATQAVKCPYCESDNTQKISEFGSTPCKSQHRCNRCQEPFDHFKCH